MLFPQAPAATLTMTRVATAPLLVAELAKATGQRLEVSPLLAREVLMVSVENARPADVMGRLALAASAAWEAAEGGLRLVPDKAAWATQAATARRQRLQRMLDEQKAKKAFAAKIAAEKAAQAKAAQAGAKAKPDEDEDQDDTGEQATDAFLPLLDLNVLASLEPGDRVVFASTPNVAQRALRGDVATVVQAWIVEHNKKAEGVLPDPDEDANGMAALMKGPLGERLRRMNQPITVAPAKVIVVASRGEDSFGSADAGVSLEVRAYAADGTVLLGENGSVGSGAAMAVFEAMKDGNDPQDARDGAAKPASQGTPFAYSPEAKAFLDLNGEDRGGRGVSALGSPIVRERILNPDRFEPLALFPGEGLVALAKARRRPLVACIPDAAYSVGEGAPKTIEGVEEALISGEMRTVPDPVYLVIKAADPDAARRDRVDRLALARLMHVGGAPSLDELATFAASAPPPGQNTIEMASLAFVDPNALGSMGGMVSWEALRLYAGLDAGQRQSLQDGSPVPFSTLSPAARNALAAMLYGASGGVTVDRPGVPTEPDPFSAMMRQTMDIGLDARDEPTEVAPDGLPPEGYLQAAVASEPVVRTAMPEIPVSFNLGLDELAMFQIMASRGAPEGQGRLPDTGVLGSRKAWALRGYVARGAYVTATLNDDHIPRDGKPVPLANLPPDVQALISLRIDRIKNSPLGSMLSKGGEISDSSKVKP